MLLVTVVGPIASGKSSVSAALADHLRAAGREVAVVDLDDVVDTVGGFGDLTPERFRTAQLVTGELVGAWLRRAVDVIAHGPFFEADEDAAILHALPVGTEHRRVHLRATYEVALRRVDGDPDRLLSRDPNLLRWAYDRVAELEPAMPTADWTFDTTEVGWAEIAAELAAALQGRGGLPGRGATE